MNNELLNYVNKMYVNKILEKRMLFSATIELLTKCNLKCIHCYNQDLKPTYMDFLLFKRIVNDLEEMGCKQITLTGGEPLLHPNFVEMYNYCYDKGFKIKIFTNGLLIDRFIMLFKKKIPYKIEISLYGSNNLVYFNVCKTKNVFDKIFNNMVLLNQEKIPFCIKTVILEANVNDFDNISQISKDLKKDFRYDIILFNSKNFTMNQKSNILINEHHKIFMRKIKREKINNWLNYKLKNEFKLQNDYLYKCYAGRRSLFVSVCGGVRICNFAEFSEKKKIFLCNKYGIVLSNMLQKKKIKIASVLTVNIEYIVLIVQSLHIWQKKAVVQK